MFDKDAFSQWLGIEIIEVKDGYCELKMTVRKEMLNGFQIAHGGIAYSLADSALAFASNSHGRKSLSVETSISHTVSVKKDDVLTAMTEELSLSDNIGVYLVHWHLHQILTEEKVYQWKLLFHIRCPSKKMMYL